MFSQIRNIWKAAAAFPLKNSQLFIQNCIKDVPKICQRHLSVLRIQTSLASRQQCPVPNQTGTLTDKKPLLFSSSVTFQSVRTNIRVHYKGSAWKRYNKHNIERRLTTPGGLEMLWRRVLKGRHQLAVYERILPEKQILFEHQRKFRIHPLTKRLLPKPGLY